jgi:undecaprenyl diphosphate synthase
MKNGVRLRCIGRLDRLPAASLDALRETEALTADNDGMLLRLALSYGSRAEMADAVRRMAEEASAGTLDPASIDEETLRAYLYDPTTPDPDLVIRTAGEMRVSNFLLWQLSYAELYVTPFCWPDFRRDQLLSAMKEFASRRRKFGGLVEGDVPAASTESLKETT